ncbi:MAG: hypothetical protein K2Q17_08845 [Nitrospiraceae bacterium]|nr:hypothetical protein [Nitrospiraceae bacterium]OQW35513.1 MAG: hypothetical protein A4E20_00530 [Nitrospira sp. SG-bin2]
MSRDRIEQQKAASFLAAFVGTWSAIGKVYNQATLKNLKNLLEAVAQSSEAKQVVAQSSEAGQTVDLWSEAAAGRQHNHPT